MGSNAKKAEYINRASIEDFQNAEKEIADKMKQSDILMKKNPSIGNLSQEDGGITHNAMRQSEQIDEEEH